MHGLTLAVRLTAPAAPQVIANTGGVLGIGGTPHEVMVRANKSIVDVDKVPFKGPKTPHAKWHKVGMRHAKPLSVLG